MILARGRQILSERIESAIVHPWNAVTLAQPMQGPHFGPPDDAHVVAGCFLSQLNHLFFIRGLGFLGRPEAFSLPLESTQLVASSEPSITTLTMSSANLARLLEDSASDSTCGLNDLSLCRMLALRSRSTPSSPILFSIFCNRDSSSKGSARPLFTLTKAAILRCACSTWVRVVRS